MIISCSALLFLIKNLKIIMKNHYDYMIIGGGIVGISTAWQLQSRYPDKRILLIEKEKDYAKHQTGHNSGVIHAGVYYEPGSLKADFCKAGERATKDFCETYRIDYQQCGKLLVATNPLELARMKALYQRCQNNAINVVWLNADELKQREPNITGMSAIWVADTAIVDYRQVCQKMAECFIHLGGDVALEHQVIALTETSDKIIVNTKHHQQTLTFSTNFLIACAGLSADHVANMLHLPINFQIIPYRGEYYQLSPQHNTMINHLIYPIPDPELPFLGIHLTKMIDGSVTIGPNAVQGFKREGYGRFNFSFKDTWELMTFPGFWKVSSRHLRAGLSETKDAWCKKSYLKRVQKYCPQLTTADLHSYPAGIRAQAVLSSGELVHDFLFAESPRSLHVCNAPSPAATSAIPIGDYVINKVMNKIN